MDELKEAVICILEILSRAASAEEAIGGVMTQYVITDAEIQECKEHLRKLQGRG